MNINRDDIIAISTKIALAMAVICSTAYLLMLGWYNVLLLDDYCWVYEVDKSGPFGFVQSMINWQNRYSSLFVAGFILSIWGHVSNLIGYTVLLLLLGYGTLYYALRNMTTIRNQWLLWALAIIVSNVSIMAYFEMSTFYWVCCAVYTLSSYATIALVTAIFFSKGKMWARWIVVTVCSLYLCGGAENFTPIVIAALGVVMLYSMVASRSWRFWITNEQKMMLVALLILGLGYALEVFGPGTKTRAITEDSNGFMGHFEFVPFSMKFVKASAVFAMRLVSRSLYYVLLFPVGVLIGYRMDKREGERIAKPIWASLIALIVLILISIAAAVYGMGWYASLRAYSFVSFLMAAMVIYWGILIGRKHHCSYKIYVLLSALIITAISIRFYTEDQTLAKAYKRNIAACHATIVEQVKLGRTEPLVVDPIPYPVRPNTYAILRKSINVCLGKKSAVISDPAHYFPYERYTLTIYSSDWKNVAMQRYFNTPFEIIGWEE